MDDLISGFGELHPENGLPEEVFLAVSSVTPIPNVDLLILNTKGEVLLSWRDDPYFGRGWHIPGGCVRFRETMEERVQKTAQSELGTVVTMQKEPIAVRDVIVQSFRETLQNQNIRAHHIAVLFLCSLPESFDIVFQKRVEGEHGFLKWFSKMPGDLLSVHKVYRDVFQKYGLE